MLKYTVTIAVLCVVVYINSIGGGFVSDDIAAIQDNPSIGNISACRNLIDYINFIIYKVAGLKTAPYHLFNIIIHAINSILVFYFLLLLFKKLPSFFGALIFAVHPIHTEAVSWISGKPYLVSTMFLLASFMLYRYSTNHKGINPRSIITYIISLFLFILSFNSNWHSATYPGIILLYDFTYARWKKNWRLWIPYILTTIIFILFFNSAINQKIDSNQLEIGSTSISNPVFNMAFSLFKNTWLILWPLKLTFYHEPLISWQLLWIYIISLILIFCSLPFLFKKVKPLFFAIGAYIIFLSPTYSPISICWLVAERYIYLPLISFCMLVSFFAEKYAENNKVKEIFAVFFIIILGFYSSRTILRNNDWKDVTTLWRATVLVSPESPKAHNNMGDVFCREGDLEKAAREFKIATELKPDYADAYHNLANTYKDMNRIDEAILNYKKAISINPGLWQSYWNLGAIYIYRNEKVLAKEYFEKVKELNPDNKDSVEILNKLENI